MYDIVVKKKLRHTDSQSNTLLHYFCLPFTTKFSATIASLIVRSFIYSKLFVVLEIELGDCLQQKERERKTRRLKKSKTKANAHIIIYINYYYFPSYDWLKESNVIGKKICSKLICYLFFYISE